MHTRFYLFVPSANRIFFTQTNSRPAGCALSALSLTDSLCLSPPPYLSRSIRISLFFSLSLSVKGQHFPLLNRWRRRGKEMPHVQESGGQAPGYNIAADKFPLLDTEEYNIKYTCLLFNMYIVYRIKEKYIADKVAVSGTRNVRPKHIDTAPTFPPSQPHSHESSTRPANLQRRIFTFHFPIARRYS